MESIRKPQVEVDRERLLAESSDCGLGNWHRPVLDCVEERLGELDSHDLVLGSTLKAASHDRILPAYNPRSPLERDRDQGPLDPLCLGTHFGKIFAANGHSHPGQPRTHAVAKFHLSAAALHGLA